MAIGIWTPVAGSTKSVVFDVINSTPNQLEGKLSADIAPVAGTHLLIQPLGCGMVFGSSVAPATYEDGFLGTPIPPGAPFVVPRTAAYFIFSPYESQEVLVSVGAMT